MSTRGIIARRTEDGGWEGRYHHFDAYPSGLGEALWEQVQFHRQDDEDLASFLRVLVDEHPAGWSNIVNVDWSLAPGFVEYGNKAEAGNRPLCYCHGDRSEEGTDLITDKGPDYWGTEWCYVIDLLKNEIEVIKIPWEGGRTPHHVVTWGFDGPEPDFTAAEAGY